MLVTSPECKLRSAHNLISFEESGDWSSLDSELIKGVRMSDGELRSVFVDSG